MPIFANRPGAKPDSNYVENTEFFIEEAFRGEYTGTNLTYAGFARPGSSENSPVWQISRFSYDGSNNLISVTWPLRKLDNTDTATANTAACSNDYEFVWAERTNYTYQ